MWISKLWPGADILIVVVCPDDAELASGDAMLGVAGDDGGDADEENFLPLEDNGMEMDQGPEEHIDRHQVGT